MGTKADSLQTSRHRCHSFHSTTPADVYFVYFLCFLYRCRLYPSCVRVVRLHVELPLLSPRLFDYSNYEVILETTHKPISAFRTCKANI
jgi:hypothetical protein